MSLLHNDFASPAIDEETKSEYVDSNTNLTNDKTPESGDLLSIHTSDINIIDGKQNIQNISEKTYENVDEIDKKQSSFSSINSPQEESKIIGDSPLSKSKNEDLECLDKINDDKLISLNKQNKDLIRKYQIALKKIKCDKLKLEFIIKDIPELNPLIHINNEDDINNFIFDNDIKSILSYPYQLLRETVLNYINDNEFELDQRNLFINSFPSQSSQFTKNQRSNNYQLPVPKRTDQMSLVNEIELKELAENKVDQVLTENQNLIELNGKYTIKLKTLEQELENLQAKLKNGSSEQLARDNIYLQSRLQRSLERENLLMEEIKSLNGSNKEELDLSEGKLEKKNSFTCSGMGQFQYALSLSTQLEDILKNNDMRGAMCIASALNAALHDAVGNMSIV